MSGGLVAAVEPGSIGQALGLRPGDVLLEINGHPLRDVLDVQFYAADEDLDLLVRRGDQEIVYQVEREYGLPLGLDFGSPTFDGIRRCQNKCEFCFVSQMPPRTSGQRRLRRSLYIRDDDYRYSVLYGSFITLTQLTPGDWERLAEQRLSPLYVSVHATEPALRHRLLGRDGIPDILIQIDRLAELGIEIHAQIVLIPALNDGPHLSRTLVDLAERYPTVRSIGVVPVGLTRYHRGRCRPYTPEEARRIVKWVTPLQAQYRTRYGVSLVYLADEWYLLAGLDVPTEEMYDGYPQLENGIGLVRQFLEDSYRLQVTGYRSQVASCTLVCGTLIAPLMQQVASELAMRSGCRIEVVPVVNGLFGETVTVSGLLAGADVLSALHGCDLGEIVFLPRAMFAESPTGSGWDLQGGHADRVGEARAGLERTLDDLTLQDLTGQLERPVMLAHSMSEVWERISRRD